MDRAELEHLLAPYPNMLTVDEVAAVLRVHRRSIQRWAREGRVASVRVGRSYRIARADVVRWMLEASSESDKGASMTSSSMPS
jgi:excisionase family DNA binding protein